MLPLVSPLRQYALIRFAKVEADRGEDVGKIIQVETAASGVGNDSVASIAASNMGEFGYKRILRAATPREFDMLLQQVCNDPKYLIIVLDLNANDTNSDGKKRRCMRSARVKRNSAYCQWKSLMPNISLIAIS